MNTLRHSFPLFQQDLINSIKTILTFDTAAFLRESPLWVHCEHPSDKFSSTCLCFVCNYGACTR